MRIYFTFLLVFLVIAFIFGSQNEEIISLNYLIAKVELSIAMVASLFTAVGFILGLFSTLLWRMIRKDKKAQTKNHSTKV